MLAFLCNHLKSLVEFQIFGINSFETNSDCGKFPEVKNGKKLVIKQAVVNATYSIELRVSYRCDDSFFWTGGRTTTIDCQQTTDGTYDSDIGRCVPCKFRLHLTIYSELQ